MRNSSIFVVILGLSVLFINSQTVNAQSPDTDGKKFEVGGQFSVLQASLPNQLTFTGIQCVTTPCPSVVISSSRELQPGFGGRIGYNITNNIGVEAEVNFFPGAGSFSVPDQFKGGHKIQGLFGVKAGKRLEKVGIFGKARPGFLYASKADLEPRPGILCIAIFPPPAGCSQTTSKTNFAFDVGGVVEVYPTKRTILRFDAGDTIIRLSERTVSATLNPAPRLSPSYVTAIRVPAETTHNFQGSIGFGFRF
jgi:outer membrane protein with beta-barrel domain